MINYMLIFEKKISIKSCKI